MKKVIMFLVAALLIGAGLYFSYNYFFVKAPYPVEVVQATQTLQHSKNIYLDGPLPIKSFEKVTEHWQELLTPIFSLLSLIGGFILIVVQIILNIKEIENLPDTDPRKQKSLAKQTK
jgi:NADH:ubiquinone oxidoreductase subunit 6 (subunit J)